MAVSLLHQYQSAIADSGDTSVVQPSDWNAEHTLSMATNKLLGRGTAGTGAAEEITLGTGLSLTGTTLNASGGAPGGSDTYVQFNDGGSTFGGDSGLTFDKTNNSLTVGGATVTTSNPVLNLSQTWNDGAVTFTGMKLNVTDTASAAASLLADFQVGGSSKFKIEKSGNVTLASADTELLFGANYKMGGSNNNNFHFYTSTNLILELNSYIDAAKLASGSALAWTNTSQDASATADLFLYRDAANTLALRNSTNAQSFRIYNSYTDGSNYSRLAINANQIKSEVAGTGTLTVTTSTPILDLAQTWNDGAVTFTGIKLNVTDTASAAASLLADFQVGGNSKAYITKSGVFKTVNATEGFTINVSGQPVVGIGRNDSVGGLNLYGDGVTNSSSALVSASGIRIPSTSTVEWASTSSVTQSPDLFLYRDAANTLALRNSTSAQTFNWYRTYTDGSNYQRVTQKWNTSTAVIHNEGLGTGADGSIAFNDAALATNATKGFLMIPSCAGAPSGTPDDIPTGQCPIVFDSTNNKLYVYDGGWLSTAALT